MTSSGQFKSIQRSTPVSKVVESEIEKAIRSRRFPTGSRLPSEHELTKQFGVSRTAIREAMRMLAARGLISGERGRGTYVREVTSNTVTDQMQLFLHMAGQSFTPLDAVSARQIVEPSIAACAARNCTTQDVALLREDVMLHATCSGDEKELAELDIRFHLHIASSTHNPLIPLLIDPLHRALPSISSVVYATIPDAKQSAVEWHTKIVEAIASRDEHAASEHMKDHLSVAYLHAQQLTPATS